MDANSNNENDIERLISERIAINSKRRVNNERYANDPAYREKIIATAKQWNAEHPDARAKIVNKYNSTSAASAQKRYRDRQREKKNDVPGNS